MKRMNGKRQVPVKPTMCMSKLTKLISDGVALSKTRAKDLE